MVRVLVVKNKDIEGLGLWSGLLDILPVSLCEVYAEDVAFLEKVYRESQIFSHLIILGGPQNVYDEFEYLGLERKLIEKFLKENKKILGICLGAQLIASVLGARVYRAKSPEVGWSEVVLEDAAFDDPLFGVFDKKRIKVFQWHEDTFDLPDKAVRLARSSVCENQAFRFLNAFALQFHIEVTKDMINLWSKVYKDEITDQHDLTPSIPEYTSRKSREIFLRFLDIKK